MELCVWSCGHTVNVGAIWHDLVNDRDFTMTVVIIRLMKETRLIFYFIDGALPSL